MEGFLPLAELGMGMVALLVLGAITLRLLSIVGEAQRDIRIIRIELSRAIGFMQAYMQRNGWKNNNEKGGDDTWTGKRS